MKVGDCEIFKELDTLFVKNGEQLDCYYSNDNRYEIMMEMIHQIELLRNQIKEIKTLTCNCSLDNPIPTLQGILDITGSGSNEK